MRPFFALVVKEFRHILRDPITLAILFGLPILQLFLFGFAITTEVRNTRFAAYAPMPDDTTTAIVERLAANEYFIFDKMLTSPQQVEEAFQRGEIGLAVVFSENFQKNVRSGASAQVQLVTDGTDPNTAKALGTYASSVLLAYQESLNAGATSPLSIDVQMKLLYNPSLKGAYQFVPGVMGMVLLLICTMMTSITIAREKENGTMEVLLVSPVHPLQIILAKTTPYFVISTLDLGVILLISVYILGVPIVGSLGLLVGLALLYIFLSLALGILISTVSDSQAAALLISGMAMTFPVILLSGMLFPRENAPYPLQLIGYIVPATWFIPAMRDVMIRGLGFAAIRSQLGVLVGMTLLFLFVALKRQKVRLE